MNVCGRDLAIIKISLYYYTSRTDPRTDPPRFIATFEGCDTISAIGVYYLQFSSVCILFLSPIFSPLSCLGTEKPKCFHVSFKTRWSIRIFTNFLASISEQNAKDDGHARVDGNCAPHFTPLCFTAAETNTYCPEDLVCKCVHDDIHRVFSPLYCDINNTATSLTFGVFKVFWNVMKACKTAEACSALPSQSTRWIR